MNLYLIVGKVSSDRWDYYDSAIVAAKTPHAAQRIHPSGREIHKTDWDYGNDWVPMDQVLVNYIGKAKVGTKEGVILASFNSAG